MNHQGMRLNVHCSFKIYDLLVSSGFDRTVFKSLRMSTDILKGPVDLPVLVWKFHLQFH